MQRKLTSCWIPRNKNAIKNSDTGIIGPNHILIIRVILIFILGCMLQEMYLWFYSCSFSNDCIWEIVIFVPVRVM